MIIMTVLATIENSNQTNKKIANNHPQCSLRFFSWRNLLAAFINIIDNDGITDLKIYKLLICWCFRIELDSEGEVSLSGILISEIF